MRKVTFASVAAMLLALVLSAGTAAPVRAQTAAPYASVESALDNGYGAYKSGYYDRAVPALEYAAGQGALPAEFYLATIFSDPYGGRTDHPKAYRLLRKMVDENRDIDSDDPKRAPFIGRAFTMLGNYLRDGIREIRLLPDREQALAYYHQGAMFFGDQEAQFELARLNLRPGTSESELRNAVHFLSALSQSGHAGAQALLADQLWSGRLLPKDPDRALALITMALETASPRDLIWIEDIHQNIACSAKEGSRKNAGGILSGWKKIFPRGQGDESRMSLGGGMDLTPQRTCKDGRPVTRSLGDGK